MWFTVGICLILYFSFKDEVKEVEVLTPEKRMYKFLEEELDFHDLLLRHLIILICREINLDELFEYLDNNNLMLKDVFTKNRRNICIKYIKDDELIQEVFNF